METDRERILGRVSELAGNRPVRWTDERTSQGDFEGRDWTVELFDVPAEEERSLLLRLIALKREIRASAGPALTFVTHTPENTTRFYPWVRSEG